MSRLFLKETVAGARAEEVSLIKFRVVNWFMIIHVLEIDVAFSEDGRERIIVTHIREIERFRV